MCIQIERHLKNLDSGTFPESSAARRAWLSLYTLSPSVPVPPSWKLPPLPIAPFRQLPPDSFQSQQLLSQQLDVLPSFQLFPPDSSSLSTTPSRPTAASLHRQLRPTASSVSPFRQLPSPTAPSFPNCFHFPNWIQLPPNCSLDSSFPRDSFPTARQKLSLLPTADRQSLSCPPSRQLPPDSFTLHPTAPNPSSSFHNNNT